MCAGKRRQAATKMRSKLESKKKHAASRKRRNRACRARKHAASRRNKHAASRPQQGIDTEKKDITEDRGDTEYREITMETMDQHETGPGIIGNLYSHSFLTFLIIISLIIFLFIW